MRRPTLNLVVDAAAFAAFVLLVASGVFLRAVLPPRSGRAAVWGLDRHAWGDVHFAIGAAFLGILALHLLLHWRWIANALRGRPREGGPLRAALGAVALLALLALAAAPFLSPVDDAPRPGRGPRAERTAP
jgi:hypothetical protein